MRLHDERVLARETESEAVPAVAVVHPASEKPDEELMLPDTLQAFEESPIYARTNGYLVRWYKDIGSHLNKGELLATIDIPEVDQELSQARASRQQIVAQMQLAKISAERWETSRHESATQTLATRSGRRSVRRHVSININRAAVATGSIRRRVLRPAARWRSCDASARRRRCARFAARPPAR